MAKEFVKGKMVPVPSTAIIPERDLDKTPILECRHLGIDFGGLRAVDDFNLILGRTEIAGLIGPNGAGKTTVFNLLTKVYQPTMGSIMLNGHDLHGMNTVQANKFDFNTSILVLVFVVFGGLGNMFGSILAAAILTVLPEALRSFATYRMLIYAIVLIVIMLVSNNEYLRLKMQQLKTKLTRKKGAPANE